MHAKFPLRYYCIAAALFIYAKLAFHWIALTLDISLTYVTQAPWKLWPLWWTHSALQHLVARPWSRSTGIKTFIYPRRYNDPLPIKDHPLSTEAQRLSGTQAHACCIFLRGSYLIRAKFLKYLANAMAYHANSFGLSSNPKALVENPNRTSV